MLVDHCIGKVAVQDVANAGVVETASKDCRRDHNYVFTRAPFMHRIGVGIGSLGGIARDLESSGQGLYIFVRSAEYHEAVIGPIARPKHRNILDDAREDIAFFPNNLACKLGTI